MCGLEEGGAHGSLCCCHTVQMDTEIGVMQARNAGSYKKSKRQGRCSLESLHREDSPADSLILDFWPP